MTTGESGGRHSACWAATPSTRIMVWGTEELLRLVHVEGVEHLKAAAGKRPIIVLAPHFIGLNMAGTRLAYEYPGTASIYSRQKNPVLNDIFMRARTAPSAIRTW